MSFDIKILIIPCLQILVIIYLVPLFETPPAGRRA